METSKAVGSVLHVTKPKLSQESVVEVRKLIDDQADSISHLQIRFNPLIAQRLEQTTHQMVTSYSNICRINGLIQGNLKCERFNNLKYQGNPEPSLTQL
jgi:cytoplasmic iron level regulating protein YaaA (DUF328/UPF0246 family)